MDTNFKNEIFPNKKFNTESDYIASLIKTIDFIKADIEKRDGNLKSLKSYYRFEEADKKRMAKLELFTDEFGEFNTSPGKTGENNKYEGIYIFIDKHKPVYVGISRNIISRIRNHGWGETSVTSSLAYLIAKTTHSDLNKEKYKENIDEIRSKHLEKVQNFKLYIHPFKGQEHKGTSEYYSLQLMEILLAVRLKTKWNTFKTH